VCTTREIVSFHFTINIWVSLSVFFIKISELRSMSRLLGQWFCTRNGSWYARICEHKRV
jgi:hypothetical protein